MALAGKSRNLLEGLVREGTFKWLVSKRNFFDEEFEEMRDSPSAGTSRRSITGIVISSEKCQLREVR